MKYRLFLFTIYTLLFVSAEVTAQFVLNGSASNTGGGCYQLTPNASGQSGNIFSQTPIDLTQPFNLHARMNFGNKDASGADGIVFILHTSNTVVGDGGGGIGYEGITPSIAIEYDDYQNSDRFDPAADHIAVISMGSGMHTGPTSLVPPINIGNIEDGEEHCFFVSWDPATQTLYATLDDIPISYTGNIINTIFNGNPIVYYGFSSGTGSLSNSHSICIGDPVLIPMTDATICEGESATLQADANGIAWNWTPDPTLSSTVIRNPVATPTATTTYTVLIQYACGYFDQDTVTVFVNPAPVAEADNDGPVCPGDQVQLLASGGNSYQWSGPSGFSSTQQNPVITNLTPEKTGIYTVTITDALGCTNEAQTEVLIFDITPVEIDPTPSPFCQNDDAFQLTGTPAGGQWGGAVGPEGIFNPQVLLIGEHVITYTVTDQHGCVESDEIIVEILPVVPAVILTPGPFCESQNPIIMMADPPGGAWSGDVLEDGSLFHTGPGFYEAIYYYKDNFECYLSQFYIEVIEAVEITTPVLDPVCINDPVFQLTGFLPPGGTFGGAASPTGMVNPQALGPGTHAITYSVSPGNCPEVTSNVDLIIIDAPSASQPVFTCNGSGTAYNVTFTISGADPFSLTVEASHPFTINYGVQSVLTSELIPSGNTFTYILYDQNGCDTLVISGSYDCNCVTQPGMPVDTSTIFLCDGETAMLNGMTGFQLDDNDTLLYVIHTGNLQNYIAIGNIIGFTGNSSDNYTVEFPFLPPLTTGTPYRISILLGDKIGTDSIDFNDPCLVVMSGPGIYWYSLPSGNLTGPTSVCLGDSATITLVLQGVGPFNVSVSSDGQTQSFNDINSGFTWTVLPSSPSTQYVIHEISDLGSGCSLTGPFEPGLTIISQDMIHAFESMAICRGDSLFVGGAYQTLAGVYTDTIIALTGCDTLRSTTLMVLDADTTYQDIPSCDSMQVGTYTELFPNQHGCDSIVITNIFYTPVYAVKHHLTTCDPAEVGVSVDTLIASNGCDSIIIFMTTLSPSDTTWITETSCNPADTGTSIVVLQNQYGCDSLLITYTELITSWFIADTTTTCNPNEAGIVIESLVSSQGCDSIVSHVSLLLPSDSLVQTMYTCEPGDTGLVVQYFTNKHGCDSIATTITLLYPPDICFKIPHELYLPNVFTPNYDGINDIFFPMANPEYVRRILYMRIYDRWGGLVFEQTDFPPNDPMYGWRGIFREKELNPGVFVYVVDVEYQDDYKEVLTGDVTLIR